jgi:hypothetical protein
MHVGMRKKEEVVKINIALEVSSAAKLVTSKAHTPTFCHIFLA